MPPRTTTNLCGFFVIREGWVIKKIKTSGKGRKCKFLHCKHILSIYNHESYCHVHLGLLANDDRFKLVKAL